MFACPSSFDCFLRRDFVVKEYLFLMTPCKSRQRDFEKENRRIEGVINLKGMFWN